jgi:DNA-binding NarL/FixJ family response regulator
VTDHSVTGVTGVTDVPRFSDPPFTCARAGVDRYESRVTSVTRVTGIAAPVRGTAAVGAFFAEQLSRVRALTREESALLQWLIAKTPSSRPLRRWTAAQDAQLRDLLANGLTAAEIGAIVGRTTDAIHTRVKRLKMKEKQDG